MIINSPPEITAYFDQPRHQNYVYAAFNGLVCVGYKETLEEAKTAFKGFEIVKLYREMSC